MPLDKPAQRQPVHRREITCEGFLREDGLIDIEASLVDRKPFDFPNKDRGGVIRAGEPLHGMNVRITIDRQLTIQDAQAAMDDTPYDYCKSIAGVFKKLVGLQIKPGFRGRVRNLMGGVKGCTHLTELLTPVTTTAIQTLGSVDTNNPTESKEDIQARHARYVLNSCHAHADHGPVVKEHWPQYFREQDKASDN